MPSALLAAAFPLSWSQYIFLICIRNEGERRFYEMDAAKNSCTLPSHRVKMVLCLNIDHLSLEGNVENHPKSCEFLERQIYCWQTWVRFFLTGGIPAQVYKDLRYHPADRT